MNRITEYWFYRILFGKKTADAIWDFQTICLIAAGVVGLVAATIYGICYVGYCLWDQVATEVSYWHKYGANWKVEFERYHGSLAHANSRLAIVFLCLLALLVILGWIGLRIYRMHKRHKYDQAGQHHF